MMEKLNIPVKRLTETAKLPQFAHHGDACADLYADEALVLDSHQVRLVATGIALELPPGWEAQIRPRSGLALKHGIIVVNSPGTIDSGYRGEVKIIMMNSQEEPFEITQGLRLAQMAIRKVPPVSFFEVEELADTERGSGGFGSTGTD